MSVEIYVMCIMLFEKQAVITYLYSYNHFSANPRQLINEMLQSHLK